MSSSRRVYLDYNASAPVLPAAREAMVRAFELGNPSSVHFEGRTARAAIEKARGQVASLVDGKAKNVIFTSGGTEAANLALTPHIHIGADKSGFSRLGLCAVEHPCVLNGHRFPFEAVTVLPVDSNGRLNLTFLQEWLAASPDKSVVALQYANNETGVLQPMKEAAALVHAAGGLLVCDAAQAAGKVPLSFECGADIFLISAHKFGGPKGAGAVILASDALFVAAPHVIGGGQENGRRGGTQNVAAIVGFGAAAGNVPPIPELRDQFTQMIVRHAPDAVFFGPNGLGLPNTLCFAVPDTSAETLLIAFDMAGISLSSGSACSSGKVTASHVLRAMLVPEGLSKAALRLSFGWATTAEDVTDFEAAFAKIIGKANARKQTQAA